VAWTAAAVSALAGMALGLRSGAAEERDRWTWWVAAAACWLVGQIAWDVFAVVGSPRSPNVADLGWWAFAALVILGLVRLGVLSSHTLRRKWRHGIVIMAALAVALPGVDPVTTAFEMIPLFLLYGLTMLVAPLVERRRTQPAPEALAEQ
jgi:hypothetical protein